MIFIKLYIFLLISLTHGKTPTRTQTVDLNRRMVLGNVSNYGRNIAQEAFLPKFLKFALGAIEKANSLITAKMGCYNFSPSFILEIENYSNQNLIFKAARKECYTKLPVPPTMIEAGTKGAFSGESSQVHKGTCGIVAWDIASEEIRSKQMNQRNRDRSIFSPKISFNQSRRFLSLFRLYQSLTLLFLQHRPLVVNKYDYQIIHYVKISVSADGGPCSRVCEILNLLSAPSPSNISPEFISKVLEP